MPKPKQSLLDDEEDVDLSGKLKVNKEYAARFQHNKEREELHRLQDKEKRGLLPDEEDESSSEEEDIGDIKPKTEIKILDVLKRIRNKDPVIYKKDTAFFGDEGSSDDKEDGDKEEGGKKAVKKSKPMYLKDVIAKQALEEADGAESDSDGGEEPTYVEEQAALKKAFLDAAGSGDDEEEGEGVGGGLKVRSRANKERDADEGELAVKELLGDVFGKDESAMDEGDRFLRNYIMNKGWVEEEDDGVPRHRDLDNVDDDEEELEEQDTFEQNFNFRYQEEGSSKIATYARETEGSIRKKDERRKRQREAKAARQKTEKDEADLQLKRLKNIKKKELAKKISKMQALAGKGASKEEALLTDLLEKDFDPEEYDKHMAKVFGDEYYRQGTGAYAENEASVLDAEVQKELAALGYEGEDGGGSGLAKVRERLGLGGGTEEWEAAAEEGGDMGEAEADGQAESRDEVMKALEEYYKLDYEQDIGGLKCRFKYRSVDAEDFGMKPDEVLGMPDKDLNDLVGLRVLAPYREDTWRHKKLRYKVMAAMGPKRREEHEKFHQRSQKREEKKQRRKDEKRHRELGEEGNRPGRPSEQGNRSGKAGGKRPKSKEVPQKKMDGEQRSESGANGSVSAARLSSYAVPKLNKPGMAGGKAKKRKRESEENKKASEEKSTLYAGLSKAQKKNMKRSAMRAEKRLTTSA